MSVCLDDMNLKVLIQVWLEVQVETTLNVCNEDAISCVSTSNDDEAHFLPPWSFDGTREAAIDHLVSIATGAIISYPESVGQLRLSWSFMYPNILKQSKLPLNRISMSKCLHKRLALSKWNLPPVLGAVSIGNYVLQRNERGAHLRKDHV